MAQLIDGDGRGLHRGLIGNTGLPPRFPSIPHRAVLLSEFDTAGVKGYYGSSGSWGQNQQQLTGVLSHSAVVQDQPFLCAKAEDSPVSRNCKSLHQGSASDSFTQSEEHGSIFMIDNNGEKVQSRCQVSGIPVKAANDVKEDGDQLTDLLEEIQQLQDHQNLPISARSQALPCNTDSQAVNKAGSTRALHEAATGHQILDQKGIFSEDLGFLLQESTNGSLTTPAELYDNDLDPKRAKRILANRQSAQRSRVRKLQYIAELERIVSTLEMEVSSLSLQVVYLKHQRALLNMDNNALKQQAIFFVQEKRNKDSQNAILKHDIHQLQKLIEFQALNKSLQMTKQHQPVHPNIQRHSSLPTDFITTAYHHEQGVGARLMKTESASADALTSLMRDFGGMSLDTAVSQGKLLSAMDCIDAGHTSAEEWNRVVTREPCVGQIAPKDVTPELM